ncbi:MAG: hypothetical protein K1X74_12495 [Pirellulales bacterium]|nr:hypothetical protein [Pirellulales bacterium]
MLASLASLTALGLIALAAGGAGRALVRWLQIDRGLSGATLAAWTWGLGLAAAGSTVAMLGLLGLLYVPILALATLIAALWGLVEGAVFVLAARQAVVTTGNQRIDAVANHEPAVAEPPRWVWYGAMGLAALVVSITWLGSLAPPTAGDALYYHLELPKRFLAEHRLLYLPDHDKCTFPLLAEMWYLWALALADAPAATLVHWLAGLLLGLATMAVAEPLLGARWSRIAGAAVLLVPGVANQMSVPMNDLAAAAYVALAVAAYRRVLDGQQAGAWALACGLTLGAALATKYLAALAIVALVSVVVWRALQGSAAHQAALRLGWIAACAALVVAAPWYARAAWHRGNPVYPFFAAHLGEPAAEALPDRKTPLPLHVTALATAPWQITMHPERFGGRGHQLGVLLLALLPGLVVARRLQGLGELLAIAAIYFLLWYALRQNVRFLLPVVPLAATAIVWVLAESPRLRRGPREIVWGSVALVGLLTPAAALKWNGDRVQVACGLQARDDYLLAHEPSYPAATLLNQYGGGHAHVLSQDYRGFYFAGPFTWEKLYRLRRGNPWQRVAPDDLSRILRAEGFSHLLLVAAPEAPQMFDDELWRLVESQIERERGCSNPSLATLHDYQRRDGDGLARRYRLIELR